MHIKGDEELEMKPPVPDAKPARPAPSAQRVLSSQQLLLGHRQLQIEHHGQLYTLRETSQGKLILTK